MNIVLHLDQLLLKLRSQVSPKWRQFGFAVRVPVETLNDLSSYQEEQRFSEIAGYWMKQHQGRLTWREVARIMKEIDLNDLAEEILSNSTGTAGITNAHAQRVGHGAGPRDYCALQVSCLEKLENGTCLCHYIN